MVVVQLVEEGPDDSGLSGTHLPGQLDEAGPVRHAVEEMGKGLPVILAEEYELRIGGYGEWLFPEPEIVTVHADLLTKDFRRSREAPGTGRSPSLRRLVAGRMKQLIFLRVTITRGLIIYPFPMVRKHYFRNTGNRKASSSKRKPEKPLRL